MTNLPSLIAFIGIAGVASIIFLESGLLIGFFLPGDSLLFTAGLLASQGYFNIGILILSSCIAAIVGDSVGYVIGARLGPRLFTRPRSLLFNPAHIARTSEFFARHGARALILARFIPIVRTFTPVLAGVGRMSYRTFLSYNVIGGFLWTVTVPLLGFFLAQQIPSIDTYLLPIVGGIIVLSLIGPIATLIRSRFRSSSKDVSLDK